MAFTLYWTVAVAATAVVVYLLYRVYGSVRTYLQLRGKMLVTCPEDHQTAAVELDAKQAGREAFTHKPKMQLSECNRWPDRKNCRQQCLREIEMARQIVWSATS